MPIAACALTILGNAACHVSGDETICRAVPAGRVIGHAQFSLEHCRSHMLLEGGQQGIVVHELQIDMQFNQVLNEAED